MATNISKPVRFTRLRALLFLLLSLAIGAVLIVGLTWFVIGSAPRSQAVAVAADIAVEEFAILPDDDAYPAALAIDADGSVYTGSYKTGALWSISPAGDRRELAESRERIGSVTGLDVGADGALYILDRLSALEAQGAVVWRYAEGELTSLFAIPHDDNTGVVLPDDIAIDKDGRIYISDRQGWILQVDADGERSGALTWDIWWRADCQPACAPTGLAYDPAEQSILLTDGEKDAIYRLGINPADGQARAGDLLFRGEEANDYGFDGITVTPAGAIYVALLNWNRVARLRDGKLLMLAKDFRGASDLAYDPSRLRLYVTNWNQFSLGFGTRPQLPFALDAIAFRPISG